MAQIERMFLGRLPLKSVESVSVRKVRDAVYAVIGAGCEKVVLVSGSHGQRSIDLLHRHPIEACLAEELGPVFTKPLMSTFPDQRAFHHMMRTFMHIFNPAVITAAQHAFRDLKGWARGAHPCSDEVFRLVHQSLFAACYFHYGLSVTANPLCTRLDPLVDLMFETAIPFALADGKRTLLCLAD